MIAKRYLSFNIKQLFNECTQQGRQKYPYAVIGIEVEKNKKILVLQLEGRVVQRKTPEAILSDDTIVEGLSPRAVRAITYLVVLEQLSPQFKLVSLLFNQKKRCYEATLMHCIDGRIDKKSASVISQKMDMIKKLSPEDAHRIGYMAGFNARLEDETCFE